MDRFENKFETIQMTIDILSAKLKQATPKNRGEVLREIATMVNNFRVPRDPTFNPGDYGPTSINIMVVNSAAESARPLCDLGASRDVARDAR